jgi:cytochrome c
MNAHPQLSKENTTTIVKYILSLAQQKTIDSLPASGTTTLNQPTGTTGGTWALIASYTDLGNGVVPLTAEKQLILRTPTLHSADADINSGTTEYQGMLGVLKSNAYFAFKGIDLTGVKKITYNYSAKDNAATIEIHAGSATGNIISTLNYQPTGDWSKFKQATAAITATQGKQDLYFVFKKDGAVVGEGLCLLDWLRFEK